MIPRNIFQSSAARPGVGSGASVVAQRPSTAVNPFVAAPVNTEQSFQSYIPATNSYITETPTQRRNREQRVNAEAQRLIDAGNAAGAAAYRRGQGFSGYEAERLPDVSGSQQYIGYNYRGQPLTQNNLKQFFEDHALYSKVQSGLVPEANVGANDLEKGWAREDYLRARGITFNPVQWNPDTGFNNQLLRIINQQNPDIAANPDLLVQIANSNPTFLSNSWDWISSNANNAYQKEQSKDKGGLGVIAEGLGQVAQFAGLASGLHGLTSGLGALTSGAGLGGAFNAGMSAAGGMTDLGGVIGNIVGNPAIGNIANVGQAALTGGYQGGTTGALIGAGGATIGAGIGEAGGIGEFLADPLGSIGGAFNVAAGGGVGGLLNTDNAMANAAQVGPGSLASNTPPVTGPIADDVITVTAAAPGGGAYSGGSYGFLASTLAGLGVPAGANLLVNESGNLTGYTLTAPGQAPVVGMVQTTPPDLVNGEPISGRQESGTGATTGNLAGGPVQSAPGNVEYTGQTVGPNGQPVYEYTITGSAGPEINIGAGGLGSGAGGAIAGAITGGAAGGATTGGATTGGGLLDASVTPTTPGGTTGTPTGTQPTLTDEELAAILAGGAIGAGIGGSAIGGASGGAAGVTPGTGMGTTTGTTGDAGGLSDAELAALLTGGVAGVGLGLGGADTGMATATGTGVGTTGVGTGAGGVGTGTGAGGTGTGGTGDGSGFGNGLDLLFPQMQGLLEMGFQPGTEADFGQYGPAGSIIKAGKSNIPQTPKRKKRGIRVNISGRARNA